MTPLRAAIIGMGGYAGTHHQALLNLEEKGHAKLICTCDPNLAAFASEQVSLQFKRRGVATFTDYRAMLAACRSQLDVVVIPTPIPLHAEMHQTCVEAGLAVYLEKPPTLEFAELERMIALDRTAKKASVVGFNFIIEPQRLALKRRLLAGEFGALKEAHLVGRWPRPTTYFSRNGWAGRLFTPDGHFVLDSCFGNAMAHFVHNLLFWAGPTELMSWANPTAIQAELYRAHAIEGADTFFVAARTDTAVVLRFALSHACIDSSPPTETLVCERATLRTAVGQQGEIRWADGRVDRMPFQPFDTLFENHLNYFRYLRGEIPRPSTTLVDCRPFVVTNDLAYVSSGEITSLGAEKVRPMRNEKEQKDYLCIEGLALAQDEFAKSEKWPSAKGWGRTATATATTVADLSRFRETMEAMARH